MNEAIRVAVEWWGQWLQKPVTHNVGDGTLNLWLTYASLVSAPAFTDEQVERFKTHLQSAIEADIARHGVCALDVDYAAQDTLREACKASGVSPNFPSKTTMYVDQSNVSVKCGYGQPYQVLFGSQTEEASE